MLYENTKTGAIIDSPCELKGGNWELADLDSQAEAENVEESEVPEAAEETDKKNSKKSK